MCFECHYLVFKSQERQQQLNCCAGNNLSSCFCCTEKIKDANDCHIKSEYTLACCEGNMTSEQQRMQSPPSSIAQEMCIWQMMVLLAAKKKIAHHDITEMLWEGREELKRKLETLKGEENSSLIYSGANFVGEKYQPKADDDPGTAQKLKANKSFMSWWCRRMNWE